MYFPELDLDVESLRKKVSEVHAEAVCSHLEKLTCPKEQKIQLINDLQDKIKCEPNSS